MRGKLPITLIRTPFVTKSSTVAMVEMCGWMHPTFYPFARSKRDLISGSAITPYLFRNSANITTMNPLPRCPISQSSVTSVMSMFNFISTPLYCDQFSHPRSALQALSNLIQSSVTSVISMFSYIPPDIRVVNIRSHLTSSPLLPYFSPLQHVAGKFPTSHSCPWHLWYSCSVAVIYDIRDVIVQLHRTFSPLLSNFWPHTIIRDIRDVNVQLHLSQLLSNFRSHTVVRDICDTHVQIEVVHDIRDINIQLYP